MNIIQKVNSRVFQFVLTTGQKAMNYGVPETISGAGCVKLLPSRIKADGIDNVLLVAGKTVSRNGLIDSFVEAMDHESIKYTLFDGAAPDPSIENVEDCRKAYLDNKCQAIVAFGGGSSMDCAKIAAARIANPNKSVEAMGGALKVSKKIARFYAVPTTAGTGSETTIAAVVTNKQEHHKYAISDPKLLPHVAVLDPELTVGLPASVTAMTGMDALTHAVEAYTNKFGSDFAYDNAKKAVKLIFENLEEAYNHGDNLEARNNMLMGSFYAGVAFTRNFVGYVHAVGHALGGMYGIPHGQAMAAIMPKALRKYGASIHSRLADLAEIAGIGSIEGKSEKEKALAFIEEVEAMNERMGIPRYFEKIKEEDIDKLASFAYKEGNPMYPVPQMWTKDEFAGFYRSLMG